MADSEVDTAKIPFFLGLCAGVYLPVCSHITPPSPTPPTPDMKEDTLPLGHIPHVINTS